VKKILFVFVLLFFTHAWAQNLQPRIVNFSISDYDAHAQNLTVMQDDDGMLYFGNLNGLLEFDGENWKTYKPKKNQFIFSMAKDEKNQIYIGGLGEFGRMEVENNGLSFQSLSENLPDSLTSFSSVWNTIIIDKKVYFNADPYLFEFNQSTEELKHWRLENGILKMFEVDGDLILNNEEGLFKFSNGNISIVPGSPAFSAARVVDILDFNKSQKLIITRTDGAYLFDFEAAHNTVPYLENHKDLLVSNIAFGAIKIGNKILVHTLADGIYIFDRQQNLVQRINSKDGLQNDMVIDVIEDEKGNLWCALDIGISYINLNSPFQYAFEGEQFQGAIEDIIKHEDTLYIATSQGVYYSVGNKEFQKIAALNGQFFDLEKINNSIYAGGAKAYLIQNGQAIEVANKSGKKIVKVGNRQVITAGTDGLYLWDANENPWKELDSKTNFSSEIVDLLWNPANQNYCLKEFNKSLFQFEIQNDKIAGLRRIEHPFEEGEIVLYTYEKQLFLENKQKNYLLVNDSIISATNKLKGKRSMYKVARKDDSYWYTYGSSLAHMVNGVIDTTFWTPELGGINIIYPISEQKAYVGTDQALVKIDRSKINESSDGIKCFIRSFSFNQEPLYNGVFKIKGRFQRKQGNKYPVFNFGKNTYRFDFSALDMTNESSLEFSYRLKGYDNKWSDWTLEKKVEFTNLDEGQYIFEIKARNSLGETSQVQSFQFEILPPWYRTWWAYLIFILLGILFLILIIWLYSRRLRKEKIKLELLVKQRTKEVEEKNENLKIVNEQISQQKALVEEKNKDIFDSIRYAERIQRSVLPSKRELKQILPEFAVFFKPKDILSGDFYWAYKNDKFIFWACVDCTGHGVPGSLMSMLGNSLLNKIVIENGITDPAEILNQLRSQLIESLGADKYGEYRYDGMDMNICRWEIATDKLTVSAAKNPVWILRNGEFKISDYSREPIGYYDDMHDFENDSIVLEKNDLIISFSDGIVDQFGGTRGKRLTQNGFKKWLLELDVSDLKEVPSKLEYKFNRWSLSEDQIDDICVFIVRV
jgi:serine phosphatase RsbU (regulator of sigma subunit)